MKKWIDFTWVTTTYLLYNDKWEVLIHKRTENCRDEWNKWDIWGGGVKVGEKLIDCVKREIKEEVNAEPEKIEYLWFREVFRENDWMKTHWISFDYMCFVENPSVIRIWEPHKISDIKWVKINEFPPKEDIHSQLPTMLSLHMDKIKETLNLN